MRIIAMLVILLLSSCSSRLDYVTVLDNISCERKYVNGLSLKNKDINCGISSGESMYYLPDIFFKQMDLYKIDIGVFNYVLYNKKEGSTFFLSSKYSTLITLETKMSSINEIDDYKVLLNCVKINKKIPQDFFDMERVFKNILKKAVDKWPVR